MRWEGDNIRPITLVVSHSALAVALGLALAGESGAADCTETPGPFEIAGEPVSKAEWRHFLQDEKAGVFSFFHTNYGAQDAPDFWLRNFGGKIPRDELQRRTRATLAGIKIEQLLARENGLVEDISWEGFLAEFARENRRRSAALKEGAVVYGPTRLDERGYFKYRHSLLVIRLKEALARKGLEPAERELSRSYDSLKTSRYASDTGYVAFTEVRAKIRQQLIDARYGKAIAAMVGRQIRADLF